MQTGFVIALAWPETYCKQAGAWYDGILRLVGINQNNYYKIGHAAIVIVDASQGSCHYFDFGRYHAPAGFGRVRDVWSDHDLAVHTQAQISQGKITNLDAILNELLANPSCHGTGQIYASVVSCNFQEIHTSAKALQQKVFIPYGPFVQGGTNCSRFVHTMVQKCHISPLRKIAIRLPWLISPSPIGIVNGLGNVHIKDKSETLPSKATNSYELEYQNF